MRLLSRNDGLTLTELVLAMAIILILSALIVPIAEVAVIRKKEIELRRNLRAIRRAIDQYHEFAVTGVIGAREMDITDRFYPPDLDVLVAGVSAAEGIDMKLKFLRRIPIDPMTDSTDWGKRSYQDDPDDMSWGGENVFDVYTQSDATALNGTKYQEW